MPVSDSYEKLLLLEEYEDNKKHSDYGTGSKLLKKTIKNGKEIEYRKKKKEKSQASIRQLFRYATCLDIIMLIVGSVCSVITGAGFPFLSIIFGDMTNTFISAQVSDFSNGTKMNSDRSLVNESSGYVPNSSISTITSQEYHEQIVKYSLQYTYLGIAIMVCAYVQFACWSVCCERQIHRIRREFFKSILRQEISWFDEHQSGELTNQLSDNLERIKEGIGDKSGLLLQYCFQFVAGFVIAFMYSWKLTLVMMALTPLMALSAAYMSKMIAESTKKEQAMYAVAGARAEEALSSIRTVIAFNGQKQEARKYEEALDNGRKTGVAKSLYTGIGFSSAFFFAFASYALAFWYGSTLILSGEISRGTVFVVFFSVMTGSFSLGNAAPLIGVISVAKGAAASIMLIIDNKPFIDSYAKGGKRLPNPRGAISFEKVTFQYPTRENVTVLTDISFTVEPGENVALVGPSGCGKSTIVNLLLRYYDPNAGKITVDGRNVNELNVRWLRNLIGVVSQEPVLFDLSIEENIRYGRVNASFDQVVESAKMANAHSFITDLPDGYQTRVGEHGAQLSGGQKQRIAIARALIRDPKILLLDEATSALDSESERVVQDALDKAQLGRTTIVIAHRLSTVRNAKKIIVLEKGLIKEIGSHSELMQAKGLYFQLVNAQMLDMGDEAGTSAELNEESPQGPSPTAYSADERKGSSVRHMSARSDSAGSVESLQSPKHVSKQTRPRLRSLLSSSAESDADRLRHELKEENVEKSTLMEILRENKKEWPFIFMGLLGSCIRGVVMPAFAFFYSQIFEAYSKTGDALQKEATFWSIMFIIIGILLAIGVISSSYCFGVSGEALTMRLRAKVYRNLLRQDVTYFDNPRHSTGRICTRLATDAPNIKAAVDFRLSTVLSSFISMLAGIVIALIYGWKLALLLLALVPIVAFGGYLNTKLRHSSHLSDSKLLEKAGKVAAEGIENIRTVQALTREKGFYDKFCDHLKLPHRRALIQTQMHSVSYAFAQAIMFFLYAACFRLGGYLVEIGDTKPLNVFKVFFAITFCGMTISWATAYFPDLIKARFSAALIFKMIRETPAIDSSSVLGLKPTISGIVRFNDVHFAYPSRPDTVVLSGLSLSVDEGQALALVGPSGCGKSTVVNLLERFYDPLSGHVSVDDFDIRTLNVGFLRQRIALVSQEPVLFNCSIQENITYGLEDVPYESVVEAANLANIHEFVLGLPDGYNTRVGEKGIMLSGGQKQRVAIARALVRKPKILILDEATSALDTENEKLVQEAMDKARAGRTCIIIAHRLSTIQSSDKIVVIKHGKVVEEGLHMELVNKRGIYYALSKMQNLLRE